MTSSKFLICLTIFLCNLARMVANLTIYPNSPKMLQTYSISGLNSSHSYNIVSTTTRESICNISAPIVVKNFTLPCDCVSKDLSERNFTIFNQNLSLPVMDFVLDLPQISMKIVSKEPRIFEPLTIQLSIKYCSEIDLNLDVEYRSADTLPSMMAHWEHISTKSFKIRSEIDQKSEFSCDNFANPGFYRIRIRDLDDDKAISDSIFINSTTQKSTPSINIRSDSIFPHCTKDFVVSWHLPECQISNFSSFRIRIFSVLEDSPEELIYLDELAIEEGQKTLAIPCSNFDILYEKFCFELISLQKVSRKFELWDRKCVNTEPILHIDGKWSSWTDWTVCSKPCGGGVQKRYRKCDKLKEVRVSYCNGSMVEKQRCNTHKCPETTSKNYENLLNNTCDCGCILTRPSGTIYAGQKWCRGNSTRWVIPEKSGSRVKFVVYDEKSDEKFDTIKILNDHQEIYWQNNGLYAHKFEVPLDQNFFIIHEKISNSSRWTSEGVYINYHILPETSNKILLESEYSALIAARIPECTSVTCQRAVMITLLVAIGLVLFVIVFTPTMVCVHLTQAWTRRKRKRLTSSEALMSSGSQRNTDMLCSGGTECTHLTSSRYTQGHHPHQPRESIPLTVTKRSIGIQLSVQSTPRFSRSARDTPRGNGLTSNASIVSGELEYDYYDPPVPGSILRPIDGEFLGEFVSDINIEEIVRRETSGWVESPKDMSDAHTQI